jgi:putative membrane protein
VAVEEFLLLLHELVDAAQNLLVVHPGQDYPGRELAGPPGLSSSQIMDSSDPPPARDDATDATRRTHLASERTELAWWRTGLTALAVALAVGRVVPQLSGSSARWPYVGVGVCFGLYGLAVFAYGSYRRRAVERALVKGGFPDPPRYAHWALAAGGLVLGLMTIALILAD